MPVSADIYGQIQPVPQSNLLKNYGDALAIQQAQNQNALGSYTLKKAQRGDEETNALAQLLKQPGFDIGTDEGMRAAYGVAPTVAPTYIKSRLDQQKDLVGIGKTKADTLHVGAQTAEAQMKLMRGALGSVAANPTPETLDAVLADLEKQTGRPAAAGRALFANARTPEELRQTAMRIGVDLDKQMPQLISSNQGGSTLFGAQDRFSGVVTPGSSVPITQTANSAAEIAGRASEGAKNRGAEMERARMVDARSRDTNQTQRELVNQERALKVETLQEKLDATKRQRQSSIAAAENQIAVIDKALAHPGKATAVGLSGTIDPRNYVPGTDATDFRSVLDQIGGTAFLQAFESLKGGGAITEVEGKKATDAIARLSRAQSDKEFDESLKDLRGVMTEGYKRLSGKDYRGAAPKADPKADAKANRAAADAILRGG